MRQIALLLIFCVFASSAPALAQSKDVEINLEVLEGYTPPDMFGSVPVNKKVLAPITPDENIKPKIKAQAPKQTKPFIPPLPPRRPASFKVPQAYIDSLLHQKAEERKPAPERSAIAKQYDSDYLGRDLRDMNAADVLQSLNGDITEPMEFVPAAPRKAAQQPMLWPLILSFEISEYEASPVMRAKLEQRMLPYLRANANAKVEISAYASKAKNQSKLNARRASLARALSIREILLQNGIAEDRSIIRAKGFDDLSTQEGKSPDRVEISPLR